MKKILMQMKKEKKKEIKMKIRKMIMHFQKTNLTIIMTMIMITKMKKCH